MWPTMIPFGSTDRKQKWDRLHLIMAKTVAQASKDPSTKVGAVIARPDNTVASMGFNGFPRGHNDSEHLYLDRELKYKLIVHAEANAIVTAREPLHGYTLFTYPLPCCVDCVKIAIQAGIKRFVSIHPTQEQRERWGDSFKLAENMIIECGADATYYGQGSLEGV